MLKTEAATEVLGADIANISISLNIYMLIRKYLLCIENTYTLYKIYLWSL